MFGVQKRVGNEPVNVVLMASKTVRFVLLDKSGNSHGGRKGLWLRVRVWRLGRFPKQLLGMEEKLLESRWMCWRRLLEKRGIGPSRLLAWSDRLVSCERVVRSEGKVPERDFEAKLTDVTRDDV